MNVFCDILQSRFEGLAGVLVYQGAVAELNTELSSIHHKIVISCYGLKLFSDVTMLTIYWSCKRLIGEVFTITEKAPI